MNIVSGIIQNSVAGFVDAGMRTAGGYAGDFLIKAGDSIENAGIAYGNTVAGKFDNWGDSIKTNYGTGPKPTLPKNNLITSGPSVASRPKQLARSNSTPASNKSKTSTALTKSSAAVKPGVSKASPNKPGNKRIAVSKSASTSSVKPQGSSVGVNNGNVKYTPGVLTGMPKAKTGAQKPASQLNKTSNASSNKPSGGEMKYTPGKVTGMPTKGASKPASKPELPSPAKTAPKGANGNKPANDKDKKEKGGQKIDRTFF